MDKNRLTAYEITLEEDLPDIASKGTVLRHKKSGARVMLIENDDENKVFNIAFRTPPVDSTGVAHILEHSVLCGSKEFPLKDPFVELVKGSLNTFLNAMTYPDKTCYPVASCNDQDFQNLMHVYLDAVFFPNIYTREEIFRQEGWHYHLEDREGPLTFNGVVYNEMKGAFSSPDDVLEREIMNSLFPDTSYGVESGGDPDHIPELTYEQFLEFHRTYYHPSNSFIYLYGNMDMNEKLDFLDSHYLSRFDHLDVDSQIRTQEPFPKMADITKEYPVSAEEGEEHNTYLSYNVVTGDAVDEVLCVALDVLDYALLGVPGAPLRKALLDAGIGEDVYGSYSDGILQPYFTVVAKGTDPDRKDEFVSIIRNVLSDIAEHGIDKKAVEAGINSMEFRYREADYASYPKGLMYSLDILGNWLYSDVKPFSQVQQLKVFDLLKKAAAEGYFENLIKTWLLDNPHGSLLTLVPVVGLAQKKEEDLSEKLNDRLQAMSDDEKDSLIEATAALIEYQESLEDPAALDCIPMLKISDIKKEIHPLTNEEMFFDDTLFLFHDVPSNGIGYVDLMFEVKERDADTVHYLGLLKSVLSSVDTDNYGYGDLCNEINAGSGGVSFGVESFVSEEDPQSFRMFFSVRTKALYHQMGFVFRMIREILETSHLDDRKRLKEIIQEIKSRVQASLPSSGHGTAVLRATAYGSVFSRLQDELSGIGYLRFIEDLDRDFDNKAGEITKKLGALLARILRPENFVTDYSGERASVEEIKKYCLDLKQHLHTEQVELSADILTAEKLNEGFTTAGQVQYVAQAGNFRNKGFAFTGALSILKTILSYDYLWMNIRVKGGAYGCMTGFQRSGQSYFVSYRDPHFRRTLDIFAGLPEYIAGFEADEREMTKYIIGTISGKDIPRTPLMQGNISRSAYFGGVTEDILQKERDEVLNAKAEDIRALAPLIEAILSDKQICVVGAETVLRKDSDLLMEIKPLIMA
ncbi:MAG: insulinase family protein [Blautia sp.]|nr:insulinase family protein [Blautia sp.]